MDKINKLKNKNVLSIGIPVHNGADFIIDTINSVRKSDSKAPIVISNNFSTDQLIPKLNKYKKDTNEKNIYLSNTKNFLSLTNNIKRTIKIAKSKYILLLSSNDLISKNYIKKVKKIILKKKPDLILRNYRWFKNINNKNIITRKKKVENYEGFLNSENPNHLKIFIDKTDQQSGLVIKKSSILKYLNKITIDNYFTEILSIVIFFLKEKKNIYYIDKQMINIRTDHGLSLSSLAYKVSPLLSWKKILFKYFNKENDDKVINEYLSDTYLSLVQVRLYGSYKLFMKEILNYIKIKKTIILNINFLILIIFLILFSKKKILFTKNIYKKYYVNSIKEI